MAELMPTGAPPSGAALRFTAASAAAAGWGLVLGLGFPVAAGGAAAAFSGFTEGLRGLDALASPGNGSSAGTGTSARSSVARFGMTTDATAAWESS